MIDFIIREASERDSIYIASYLIKKCIPIGKQKHNKLIVSREFTNLLSCKIINNIHSGYNYLLLYVQQSMCGYIKYRQKKMVAEIIEIDCVKNNKQYARQLLSTLCNKLEEQGISEVIAWTTPENLVAKNALLLIGFHKSALTRHTTITHKNENVEYSFIKSINKKE